jgi:outer membrane protein OmpA-like peptidoglycan-associated protein
VELNRKLSLLRAERVVEWLVAHGIPAGRLTARGFGTAEPAEPAGVDDRRARQRRVEFVILETGGGTP